VLVVGDVMVDRYIFGVVSRVSPEAPIPVLLAGEEESRLGGAGNVALNLRALGAKVALAGVVGMDDGAEICRSRAEAAGIDLRGVVVERDRPTSVKTRLISRTQQHSQQVLRVDRESTEPIGPDSIRRISRFAEREIPRCDVVILSDYAKGSLPTRLVRQLIRLARRARRPVLVDPKGTDYSRYRGASAVTPNRKESQEATGIEMTGPKKLEKIGRSLLTDLSLEVAIVTLDREGIALFPADGKTRRFTSKPVEVSDGTGAGDAVIAALGWGLAIGASWEDAAAIATVAGGLEVQHLGVVPIPREELLGALQVEQIATAGKVMSPLDIDEALAARRARGERVVFTNGCFDLMHAGHVRYLKFARAQGDCLVVGLNSDRSVRKQDKGGDRPLVGQGDRAETLAALESVDFVAFFDEPTPLRLIQRLKPDVIVKGEDWREKGVVGQAFVENRGGKVVFAPLLKGRSTTRLVGKIRRSKGEGAR
jgi:D-beta-D-heptose 7-phosphate kinase/D-beta-D-heptose 1-phosphate adenosyltransferase